MLISRALAQSVPLEWESGHLFSLTQRPAYGHDDWMREVSVRTALFSPEWGSSIGGLCEVKLNDYSLQSGDGGSILARITLKSLT